MVNHSIDFKKSAIKYYLKIKKLLHIKQKRSIKNNYS